MKIKLKFKHCVYYLPLFEYEYCCEDMKSKRRYHGVYDEHPEQMIITNPDEYFEKHVQNARDKSRFCMYCGKKIEYSNGGVVTDTAADSIDIDTVSVKQTPNEIQPNDKELLHVAQAYTLEEILHAQ